MVIAFVGAGSYVFGPSVLQQLFASGLEDVELRLIDPNLTATRPLAEAAEAEAVRRGRTFRFPIFASLHGALDGADAVIHSAAPGMRTTFARNRAILAEHYPEHLVSEFGGVHGIAYSLAQIRFMQELGEEMLRACPKARLMVSANPLPRVGTAAARMGLDFYGFCSVAMVAYGEVGRRLFGIESQYPFQEIVDRVDLATVGTNHLSWVVRLNDRATGEDLLPALRATARPNSPSKVERYLARTGYLLAPGDEHTMDFLPIEGDEPALESTSHGSEEDRNRRMHGIQAVLAGRMPLGDLDEHPAWEFPAAALEAMAGGPALPVITLNLPNRGQVPQLPAGAIVETPAVFRAGEAVPEVIDLPAEVAEHNLRAVEITEALVDAGLNSNHEAIERALLLDPTIIDKSRGRYALGRCLAAMESV